MNRIIINEDSREYKSSHRRGSMETTKKLRMRVKPEDIKISPLGPEDCVNSWYGYRDGHRKIMGELASGKFKFEVVTRQAVKKSAKAEKSKREIKANANLPYNSNSAEYNEGFGATKHDALAVFRAGGNPDDFELESVEGARVDTCYWWGCLHGLEAAKAEFRQEQKAKSMPTHTLILEVNGNSPVGYNPNSDLFKQKFKAGKEDAKDLLKQGHPLECILAPEFTDEFDKNEYCGYCLGIQAAKDEIRQTQIILNQINEDRFAGLQCAMNGRRQ